MDSETEEGGPCEEMKTVQVHVHVCKPKYKEQYAVEHLPVDVQIISGEKIVMVRGPYDTGSQISLLNGKLLDEHFPGTGVPVTTLRTLSVGSRWKCNTS